MQISLAASVEKQQTTALPTCRIGGFLQADSAAVSDASIHTRRTEIASVGRQACLILIHPHGGLAADANRRRFDVAMKNRRERLRTSGERHEGGQVGDHEPLAVMYPQKILECQGLRLACGPVYSCILSPHSIVIGRT